MLDARNNKYELPIIVYVPITKCHHWHQQKQELNKMEQNKNKKRTKYIKLLFMTEIKWRKKYLKNNFYGRLNDTDKYLLNETESTKHYHCYYRCQQLIENEKYETKLISVIHATESFNLYIYSVFPFQMLRSTELRFLFFFNELFN